jgi:hypothetical protein
MVDAAIQNELSSCLSQLPLDQQKRVLDFARNLVPLPLPGVLGSDLLPFSGAIDETDLDQMAAAIDDCNKVDPREW